MKKLGLILLLVLIFGAGGIVFYMNSGNDSLLVEDVLPQDALGYINMKDGAKNIEELKSTELWQRLSKINIDKILETMEVPQEQQTLIKQFKKELLSEESRELMSKFFGKEFSLALYMPDEALDLGDSTSTFDSMDMEKLFASVFLVTRMTSDMKMLEFLSRSFKELGEEVEVSTDTHKKHTLQIYKIKKHDLNIVYVRIKDLLVVGIGDSAARKAIDIYEQDIKSLKQDVKYQKISKSLDGNPYMLGFWDTEKTLQVFKEQTLKPIKDADARMSIQESFANMTGFKNMGVSASLENGLSSVQVSVVYDKDTLDPNIAKMYNSCKNADNKTINFVPKDVLLYHWGTCSDMNYYWNEIQGEMKKALNVNKGDVLTAKVNQIEQKLGLSIEKDIIPAFGYEIGGFLSEIQLNGLFPLPKLVLFAQVGEKDKMEKLISKLIDSPMIMMQEETYAGSTIHYVLSPMGEMIEPSYIYYKDYLVIAINRKLLKDIIDSDDDNITGLVSDDDFKSVNYGLTDPLTTVQFIKVSELTSVAKEIIKLSMKMASQNQSKQDAFKSGSMKRLQVEESRITSLKKKLNTYDSEKLILKSDIAKMTAQGLDVLQKKTEQEILLSKIKGVEKELKATEDQIIDLQQIIKDQSSTSTREQDLQFLISEIVNPLLDAVGAIKALSTKITFEEGYVKTSVYWKE